MCLGERRFLRRSAWRVAAVVDWLVGPFERRRRPVSPDAAPIFVVGCSHSGTTILTALLNGHPGIVSLSAETKVMCHYRTARTHRAWLASGRAARDEAGADRFCEKTPNHVFFIDRILRCYPNARVVVIERDGRDVAVSLAERWNGGFEFAVRKWVAAVRAAAEHADDARVMTVRYERFVSDPAEVMDEVIAFVGEQPTDVVGSREYWAINYDGPPPDDGVTPTDHHEYRAWQVNQPIFDGSGRWRTELTDEQRADVVRIAGAELARLGYADA